ncbi:GNAT family N-acetyltransferase [Streptomyces sp. NPDC059506]|uniref:GNAT family N-acetyltransferase n=1 Tax=unclassified Streptomyces TaxID=2593676 RepID=UPI0022AAA6F5|nr:GNAT family N-acetyltransferase [Streptomyces sp. HB2AG]MCZ2524916.1 GNAT family N-acetyltransferase [Streptomyces sp. HB2AG]
MDTASGTAPDRTAGTARPAFRTATAADVPALVELVESAYRGDASRVGWTTEADLLEGQRTDAQGVAEIVAGPSGEVLVAEEDGVPVACCQVEHRGSYAYFGMFAVRPGLQGSGLGRTVLAEAERFAAERWGVTEMRMTVITARRELIAWYERRGYRRTGQTEPFPYGDERFGLPLRDDLEFELLVRELPRG